MGRLGGAAPALMLLVLVTGATAAAAGSDRSAGSGGSGCSGRSGAEQALVLCARADELAGAAKQELLGRALALAEDAVGADPGDPRAHFAVVCALGKQTQLAGVGLWSFAQIARVRRELDLTLELAPDDGDALAAKGALLVRLPWLLGGDRAEGKRLLRRALAVDPLNLAARRYLVEALGARGDGEDEAAAFARARGASLGGGPAVSGVSCPEAVQ